MTFTLYIYTALISMGIALTGGLGLRCLYDLFWKKQYDKTAMWATTIVGFTCAWTLYHVFEVYIQPHALGAFNATFGG